MSFYGEISSNKLKTYLLFVFFFMFILAISWSFSILTGWGSVGLGFAAVIAIIISIISYYFSDSIVLKISNARPATKEENAYLVNSVESLSIGAGIPKPRLYIIEDTAPNAFATGRNPENSIICVTTGLLQKLNRLELEGVLGHEMSHIKNYDIRVMTYATIAAGIVVLLSDLIFRSFWYGNRNNNDSNNKAGLILVVFAVLLAILAPFFAQLIKLAISRNREYLADASAAKLTRYPEGLASALAKISKDKEPLEAANKATAHLYISNPLKGHESFLNNLFSTHPPIASRILKLRQM